MSNEKKNLEFILRLLFERSVNFDFPGGGERGPAI
jgi:hypothetical protein